MLYCIMNKYLKKVLNNFHYIKIETNSPMSAGDDGTINLHSKETIFKVEKGKKLKLTTLTLDFGFIYTFELK